MTLQDSEDKNINFIQLRSMNLQNKEKENGQNMNLEKGLIDVIKQNSKSNSINERKEERNVTDRKLAKIENINLLSDSNKKNNTKIIHNSSSSNNFSTQNSMKSRDMEILRHNILMNVVEVQLNTGGMDNNYNFKNTSPCSVARVNNIKCNLNTSVNHKDKGSISKRKMIDDTTPKTKGNILKTEQNHKVLNCVNINEKLNNAKESKLSKKVASNRQKKIYLSASEYKLNSNEIIKTKKDSLSQSISSVNDFNFNNKEKSKELIPTFKKEESNPAFKKEESNPALKKEDSNPPFKKEESNPAFKKEESNPAFKKEESNPAFKKEEINSTIKKEDNLNIFTPKNITKFSKVVALDLHKCRSDKFLLNSSKASFVPTIQTNLYDEQLLNKNSSSNLNDQSMFSSRSSNKSIMSLSEARKIKNKEKMNNSFSNDSKSLSKEKFTKLVEQFKHENLSYQSLILDREHSNNKCKFNVNTYDNTLNESAVNDNNLLTEDNFLSCSHKREDEIENIKNKSSYYTQKASSNLIINKLSSNSLKSKELNGNSTIKSSDEFLNVKYEKKLDIYRIKRRLTNEKINQFKSDSNVI